MADTQNKIVVVDDDMIVASIEQMTKREVIQQIMFDPHFGMVKREIYFGIIDYVTVNNIISSF